MTRHIIFALAMVAALSAKAQTYNIVPQPAEMELGEGYYTLSKKGVPSVAQRRDASMAAEAYRLEVTSKGITVTSSGKAGQYYAQLTLEQMVAQAEDGHLPSVTINDSPRFGYRGFMLDVVRTYVPLDDIKRMVDVAARLKLNTLHLHLTDDNGWRLEIKRYPKLTEVGAWRVDRPELFPGRLNARSSNEKATYGGYYTQKEMRELVRYCAARNITVLPEIEMPAHSAGLLASYPELACPVVDKFIGVFPGIGGKDASIICCAGNERVYQVYQDILDEVMAIFPSKQIHLGGDEANKAMWDKCPLCQAKIREQGLRDSEELQGYFMDRINRYVRQHGRMAIGWDEVTMGSPKEEIAIMGWRGNGEAAIRDSKANGRQFILTPAKKLYLIRYQGPQWFEPFTYFGNNTLADCYNYEPVAADWDSALESNLLGIQGSMWNEFCPTPSEIQYMVFPRLVAIADIAWAKKGTKDWPNFLKRLDTFLPALEKSGVNYARSMYNIDHSVQPSEGKLKVTLSCIRPDVEIRYASSEDALAKGTVYQQPFYKDGSMSVYAATFKDGKQAGKTLRLDLRHNTATACKLTATACTNGLSPMLVNGLRGSDRISDSEWAGWYNSTAEFTLDLGSVKQVRRATLGNIAHSDICVAAPQRVMVYASTDGTSFNLIRDIATPAELVFHPAVHPYDIQLVDAPTTLRYLKVVALNPGCIPDGLAREGTPTWMYFDELTVE